MPGGGAFALVSLFLLLSLATRALSLGASNWTLVWRDDFNGPKGSPPSSLNWFYDIGQGCWGTGEIEMMTNSTQNCYLDGKGNLIIAGLRDQEGNWTSARIGARPLHVCTLSLYMPETVPDNFAAPPSGVLRVQARIRLLANIPSNASQGYWPAFWMLGSTLRQGKASWPACGEIDILETIDGQKIVHGTLHCGIFPNGPCHEPGGLGGPSPDTTTEWHDYAIELDTSISPQALRWYLDSKVYWTVVATTVDANTWTEATAHPFFIILDLAIGGGWPGNPTAETQSGGKIEIDYVAVYTSQ